MKKAFFALILLFQACCVLFAFSLLDYDDETASSSDNNITINAGIGFLFPVIENTMENLRANIGGSLLFFSAGAGIGRHFSIVENIVSPGIYADIHVSVLSLFLLLLNDTDEEGHIRRDKNQKIYFGIWQFGIRLYNHFGFGPLDIQPFFGLNALVAGVGNIKTSGFKTFGILLAINQYGIEFGYQLPLRDRFRNRDNVIYRIIFIKHS